MNLSTYTFDDGIRTDPKLLEEAKSRGFLHGRTKYNDLVSKLFFDGGEVKWKEGLSEEFEKKGKEYFHKCIRSWDSKHEHKEAVCALLLSELAEV